MSTNGSGCCVNSKPVIYATDQGENVRRIEEARRRNSEEYWAKLFVAYQYGEDLINKRKHQKLVDEAKMWLETWKRMGVSDDTINKYLERDFPSLFV